MTQEPVAPESESGEASRGRRSDRKRSSILDAAVREFRSRGYDSTSMDRIAEVAGVSKRTVYNHFGSKEILFESMVQQLKERCEGPDQYRYQQGVPLDEQLTRIAHAVIEINSSSDFQDLSRVILARFLSAPELAQQMLGEAEEFSVGVANWIRGACRDGKLRVADPERAAKQFKGLLGAFTFWPQVIGREQRVSPTEEKKIVQSTVAMFLDHYAK